MQGRYRDMGQGVPRGGFTARKQKRTPLWTVRVKRHPMSRGAACTQGLVAESFLEWPQALPPPTQLPRFHLHGPKPKIHTQPHLLRVSPLALTYSIESLFLRPLPAITPQCLGPSQVRLHDKRAHTLSTQQMLTECSLHHRTLFESPRPQE